MLSITNLSVSIDDKPILNTVNLVVQSGTTHVLMGPNGSGKSTLAAVLMGHPQYQVTGSMQYHDKELTTLSPDKRAQLGLFLGFQHPLEIPGLTIVTFLKEAHQAVTGNKMSVAEFTAYAHTLLAVLNLDASYLYRNLNEGFSGGEKKRLELLQMLVLNPSLVILDEIDSGLDVDALSMIAHALAHLKKTNNQLSVLVITHYQRIVQLLNPDQIHIMQYGSIVKSGDSSLADEIEHKGYHGTIAN